MGCGRVRSSNRGVQEIPGRPEALGKVRAVWDPAMCLPLSGRSLWSALLSSGFWSVLMVQLRILAMEIPTRRKRSLKKCLLTRKQGFKLRVFMLQVNFINIWFLVAA